MDNHKDRNDSHTWIPDLTDTMLVNLKTRVQEYIECFYTDDPEYNRAIRMKENHTKRVALETRDIAKALGLSKTECYLAESIALLHDIGRFEQYKRYTTYKDNISVNHAHLSRDIIQKENFLSDISIPEYKCILYVIAHHNAAHLPHHSPPHTRFYLQLLRDADKIDIWYVVTNYYANKNSESNAIELDLPDTAGISDEVYKDIVNKNIVSFDHIKNFNDFKILQMGWIFDIHFTHTFHTIQKRNYLDRIYESMSRCERIDDVYRITTHFLERKCTNARPSDTLR
jgi:putative nucleotidyltransferase with HDIG domain